MFMQFGRHVFADRAVAGRELGRVLVKRKLEPPLLVLGLPRGGVPVAYEVARALHAPLDVMIVRKIGMPGQPELAIGAIASGNITVRGRGSDLDLPFEQVARRERAELERRERSYRADRAPLQLQGKTVVLVDDGLATGATMIAAVRAARQAGAMRIVVAAPVASDEATQLLAQEADELVILETPPDLFAIGQWYENFTQVEDAEVCALLERVRHEHAPSSPQSKPER